MELIDVRLALLKKDLHDIDLAGCCGIHEGCNSIVVDGTGISTAVRNEVLNSIGMAVSGGNDKGAKASGGHDIDIVALGIIIAVEILHDGFEDGNGPVLGSIVEACEPISVGGFGIRTRLQKQLDNLLVTRDARRHESCDAIDTSVGRIGPLLQQELDDVGPPLSRREPKAGDFRVGLAIVLGTGIEQSLGHLRVAHDTGLH
mmetsp:Transcript_524/g.1571  ORF Transcript_524/g.1571 Transcript_524/m.1571 type:complete len:202 (-) Transcript_524:901-1506(-)